MYATLSAVLENTVGELAYERAERAAPASNRGQRVKVTAGLLDKYLTEVWQWICSQERLDAGVEFKRVIKETSVTAVFASFRTASGSQLVRTLQDYQTKPVASASEVKLVFAQLADGTALTNFLKLRHEIVNMHFEPDASLFITTYASLTDLLRRQVEALNGPKK